MSTSNTRKPILAWLWLLLFLALSTIGLARWLGLAGFVQTRVETDILALLPQSADTQLINRANQQLASQLERQVVVLVGGKEPQQLAKTAQALQQAIHAAPALGQTRTIDTAKQLAHSANSQWRWLLLSQADKQALQQQQGQPLIEQALLELFSPSGGERLLSFADDPFKLLQNALATRPLPPAPDQLLHGFPLYQQQQQYWLLIPVTLLDSPFSPGTQARWQQLLADARHDAPALTINSSGVINHAGWATRQAQSEMSTIGLGSLVGVILLMLWVFRSPWPLLQSLLAIGSGLVAGLAVTGLVFERVHLLTLVFGASLVGVAVDYALHFFADRLRAQRTGITLPWPVSATVGHIGPGITLGLVTSLIGYLALLVAPMAGLQQMACFSAAGLLAAFLSVRYWLPWLTSDRLTPAPGWLAALHLQLRHYQHRWLSLALLLLTITGAAYLSLMTPSGGNADDIGLLHKPPAELLAIDQQLARISGQTQDFRYLLVAGTDDLNVAQKEAAILKQLQNLQAAGSHQQHHAIGQWLPLPEQQRANHQLLASTVYGSDGALVKLLQQLGSSANDIQRQRQRFPSQWTNWNTQQWLQTPLGQLQANQWLPESARIIRFSGIQQAEPLRALASQTDGVYWVDRRQSTSELLASYRQRAVWVLIAAYGLILLLLIGRYGCKAGFRVLLPPVAAAILATCSIQLLGLPLNLFVVLALFLVLGIGIDYTIFFREAGQDSQTTLLAIVMSSCTTLLSFGLLAASATPALQSFGLTMLLGISLALLFSPLATSKASS